MSSNLKGVLWLLVLALLGIGIYVVKLAWYDRYVWPSSIPHMQDLPPLDRSGWPASPAAWSMERQQVDVAIAGGLETREVLYYVNSIGMDLVRIEPGTFHTRRSLQLKSRDIPENDQPEAVLRYATRSPEPQRLTRRVTVSRGYYLGAFEVSNAQFELFDPDHRDRRPDYQQGAQGDDHPVEPVTWQEAQRFARWLSVREGRRYRLPSEAEWEYAARAGTTTRFYWGNAHWDRSMANLGGLHSNRETWRKDGYRQTAAVGRYPANPWGLYDMVGNAYEWVADWYGDLLSGDYRDPTGPAQGHVRVGKGGGWSTRLYAMSVAERDGNNPADIKDRRGFRLLVELGGD